MGDDDTGLSPSNTNRINSSSGSQISSVGFNNLKKLNTNSSVSTTASSGSVATNTAASTGPTKTNALARLFTRNRSNTTLDEPSFTDDELERLSPTLERRPSNVFRLAKKGKRKGKNPKDLTVQTDTPLLPQPNVLARKPSVNSPVSNTLHNLFHRSTSTGNAASLGNNNLNSITAHNNMDILDEQMVRSAVNLSSNNSNSTITDPNFAQVFKFTDPNFSLEDDFDDLELYKKLFVPADQFLKLNLPNSPVSFDDDYNDDIKFWNNLLTLFKPIILSSQQKRLTNGLKGCQLIMTEEDIANYIRENYCTQLTIEGEEELNDIKAREVTQDLSSFFNRLLILFSKDYKASIKEDLDPLAKEWIKLNGQWIYFRNKILFFILNSFTGLNENRLVRETNIQIEALLLNTFKDVIILPFIQQRYRLNSKDNNFLRNYQEGLLLDNMVHCFGMINSIQVYDDNDDRNNDFIELFTWLTQL